MWKGGFVYIDTVPWLVVHIIADVCMQNCFCDILTDYKSCHKRLPEVVPFCKSDHIYNIINI